MISPLNSDWVASADSYTAKLCGVPSSRFLNSIATWDPAATVSESTLNDRSSASTSNASPPDGEPLGDAVSLEVGEGALVVAGLVPVAAEVVVDGSSPPQAAATRP